jgi:asparagine synthase (glutamine-hydrolysing)
MFGCWRLDARPLDRVEIERCLAQLLPPGSEDTESWIGASAAIGHKTGPRSGSSHSSRLAIAADGTVGLFVGRLDNRGHLIRSLKDQPVVDGDAGPCTDSALIVAAYQSFGDGFVDRIDGDFAIAVFDGRRSRLLLARDRLGMRPLCYTRTKGAFLFGTDAKALLAYPGIEAAPDDTALADFVLYFLAADSWTRTFFRNIHSLPPGHLLIADADGVAVRRYFEFDTSARLRLPDIRAYAAALHDVFTASVRKRLRSERPVAVALSGGLDSSYIFCAAERLVREEPGLCPAVLGLHLDGLPGTPSDECRFIEEIERTYGCRIDRLPEAPGFLEDAPQEVWSSESPRVDRLSRQGRLMRTRAHEAGAARLLTGHWGDQVLSDSDYLLDLLKSGRWRSLRRHAERWRVSTPQLTARLARRLVTRVAPPPVVSVVRLARARGETWQSGWFTPPFRALLRDRFLAERPAAPLAGTSHAGAIHRQSRLPYHVHCMEWNVRVGAGSGLDVAFPYLDRDLIQFLMSIPGEIQSHDGVSRGLMRQAMRGTVPDAIVERRDKGEFTHVGRQSLERDRAAISALLGRDALSVRFGYVDGPALRKAIEAWSGASHGADGAMTGRLTDLCGLELLLRRFFPVHVAASVSRC